MSEALDYLVKARPEAMSSYFKFLKEAGKHLDPKTRALISVITKVAVQTEKGFKQYLSRALKEGCSANEILDALLMAFPVLGLSKTVWAVEILLAMDLPEFQLDNLEKQSDWHFIASLKAINPDEMINKNVSGRELFIYRSADVIKVYDSHCPHQKTNIPLEAVDDKCLTCPKHGWQFDIRTGECIAKGNRPLTEYETKVESGNILVYL